MSRSPTVAYVLDPRFPGGTSSAVAAELAAIAAVAKPVVHAVTSAMFKGTHVAPPLADAFAALGIEPVWDAPTISADLVVLHNPSFLKFDATLAARIVARHLVVVTHENFLRPGGTQGFDVAGCLGRIDRACLALRKSLVPVSAHNRRTVDDWAAAVGLPDGWDILPDDWFNICAFDMAPPNAAPRDRRGRHSRPGLEKFPARAALDLCFPAHAETNVLLGAEVLIAEGVPPHWQAYPFRGLELARYFEMIDFMVYFTAPTWQESFGRVLAEGLAAGKVVISDAATAATFGGGVIAATPEEVDGIVAFFTTHPARYAAQVRSGQDVLSRFSPDAFRARFEAVLAGASGRRQA